MKITNFSNDHAHLQEVQPGSSPCYSSASDPYSPSTLNSRGVTVSLILAERAGSCVHEVLIERVLLEAQVEIAVQLSEHKAQAHVSPKQRLVG